MSITNKRIQLLNNYYQTANDFTIGPVKCVLC